MNYRATGWAYDLPLKGSRKPVLSALADMADESNSCYPGQDKIAHMTGLSTRTVRRALDDLEADKLIERMARRDRSGHRSSDRSVLKIDRTWEQVQADKLSGRDEASDEPPADDPNRTPCPSLPDTVSEPTGHRVPVTTSRTTRENHQSDTGSVSPVRNVPRAPRRAEPDRFDPDVIEYANLIRVKNLTRVLRTIRRTIPTTVHPMGALELVQVLTDRATRPVDDVDAYVATACRDTPADVRRWWIECDFDAYNHPNTKEKAS